MKGVLFISFCFFSLSIFAQDEKVELKGTITEANGTPIPYVTILVYTLDSVLVNGASSDTLGEFSVSLDKGNYYAKFRFLSFQEKFISSIIIEDQTVDLGIIILQPKTGYLDAIDITVEKPQMELKLDKRVFNITKDISTAGLNAADILDNIPSISVDAEGNVSLRGNSNVRILINGKPSTLSNTEALRQINGNMIESVEVITNPSARYDAEGEVGIINIILKKEMGKGVNGSFNMRIGYPVGYGAGFNFNVRREKVNFFVGYGYGHQNSPGSGFTNQEFNGIDTSYRYEQTSLHNRGGSSHNVNAGFDFNIGKRSSLTFTSVFRISDGDNNSAITYRDFDFSDNLTQTVTRDEFELDYGRTQEYTLTFRKTFTQKERLFTFDVKKNFSIDNESSDLTEISSDALDASIFQRTVNDETEDSWLFQTDYIHPLGKEGKFETGAKVSLRNLSNDYQLEDSLSGTWNPNSLFNNYLKYTENIYAAYIMAGNKTKKFSYQGGIRAEFSDITTNLVETSQVNHRQYLRWFPSFHFSYELKKDNFLQISYSRRISRPRSWWLTPFYTFKDSRNYESGNPNINPEFAGSYELGHLKYWKKGSILTSIYYRRTVDFMDRILLTDSTGITWRLPVNLGTANSFGIEFSGSYAVFKWCNINGNFNFYRSISEGEYLGIIYANDAYAWSGKITSKFTIKRKFALQTSFSYESPTSTNQGSAKAQYFWDGSMAWDILKGNGTISFNARDILNTRKRRNIVESTYFYSESSFQWRSRQLTLSFVYRLNQKKTKSEMGGDGGDGGM